jgi:hypothetical protein
MRLLACVVALGAAVLMVAAPVRATLVHGERISITTNGSIFHLAWSAGSDRGSAVRLPPAEILCGGRGCLILHLLGRSAGTWTVASGTGTYAGWHARGRFAGGLYDGLLVEAE